MKCTIVNWPKNGMAMGNDGKLHPIPEPPHSVTRRHVAGDEKYGIGQSAVEINAKVWINEIYVRVDQ